MGVYLCLRHTHTTPALVGQVLNSHHEYLKNSGDVRKSVPCPCIQTFPQTLERA